MTHSDVGLDSEKQELEAVLRSGIFDRAPNLEQVLTYVCAKYFEGSANQIKEYSIAVDALGRPADFDQKRDSIVRVEAHRLRKRLRDYYSGDGALHSMRIEIPPGQYAPRFVPQREAADVPNPPDMEPPTDSSEPAVLLDAPVEQALPMREAPSPAARGRRVLLYAGAIVVVLAAGAAVMRTAGPSEVPKQPPATVPTVAGAVSGSREVRILAGLDSGSYTDRSGRLWQSDRYFQGGGVFDVGDRPIFGTREPRLYQTRREGIFSYDIPLAQGVYELRLYFAETLYGENNAAGGGETSRIFDIFVNGSRVLQNFDVIGEVGPTTADVRAFKDVSPASDGKLHLRFETVANPAFVNAIEVTPGTSGRLRPIRIVSRDHGYTDRDGQTWEPDRYAHGGQLVVRTQPVETSLDPELFHGERFGNLRYIIPVPPGQYAVTLYFAEEWFGPGTPAGGGAGSRIFDILANGVALRRGFDIYKEARGSHRAISFTSHNLEPDAQGKLEISLHPVRNYACVNAIEVIDESTPGGQ